MPRIRSSGLTVVLEHPETGRTLTPDPLADEPQILPSVNGVPEIRVPVRRSDALLALPQGTPMTVYSDGTELPVDELVDVERDSDRVVLVGEGGIELRDRVTEEWDSVRRTDAARDVIAQTPYQADVDEPDVDVATFVAALADDTASFEALFSQLLDDPTAPFEVDENDRLVVLQTAHVVEAEDTGTGFQTVTDDDYSGGEAAALTAENDSITFTVDLDYEYVDPHFIWRDKDVGDDSVDTALYVDGTLEGSTTGSNTLEWDDSDIGQTVGPGPIDITFQVDGTVGTSTQTDFDLVGIADYAYHPTAAQYDNQVHEAGGYLDSPRAFPDEALAQADTASQIFPVLSAALSVDIDPTPAQRLEVSFDGGETWLGETDVTEIDEDNTETDGVDVKSRIGIGYDDTLDAQDATPRFGYEPQRLNEYELAVTVEQVSLLIDDDVDDDAATALSDIAGDRFIWSYRLDDGEPTVAFTQPGQREADRDPSLDIDPKVSKDMDVFESVTVKGSNQPVSEERWQASTTFDELARSNIKSGSESVYDPADGTQFTRGEDYELRRREGEIRALSDGDLETGETYHIDYEYTVQGTHTVDDAGDDPRELIRTIPGITSDASAQQVAFILAEEFNEPRYTADVVLPRGTAAFDPLEALSLEQLDLPEEARPLAIRESPDVTPEGVALRLGSRRRLEAALGDLSSRVRAVSRRS